jgi:catechol 2,3-dioxygenase-like lactoylglutathione lyase family enzyme
MHANRPGGAAVLGSCDIVAFVATADPVRARAFYEESLGLRLVSENPFALVFDANGIMLRVTRVETVVIAPYTVLGWAAPDIAETTAGLAAKGVAFERYSALEQDELGIWNAPDGAKVAWFRDPDGNTLSLTQF